MTKAAHYPGKPTPAPAREALPATGSQVLSRSMLACGLLVLAGIAGCGGGHPQVRASAAPAAWAVVSPSNPAAANAVLMRAISLVGTPYLYGGNSPSGGFDGSGLVNYVYRNILELNLPRTSAALAGFQGPKISPRQLTAADLVFFGRGGNVSHVGIYVGEGRFVHAPSSGGTVRLDHLDGPYWRDHYSGARRVLN